MEQHFALVRPRRADRLGAALNGVDEFTAHDTAGGSRPRGVSPVGYTDAVEIVELATYGRWFSRLSDRQA